jgi:hypothetical protein
MTRDVLFRSTCVIDSEAGPTTGIISKTCTTRMACVIGSLVALPADLLDLLFWWSWPVLGGSEAGSRVGVEQREWEVGVGLVVA